MHTPIYDTVRFLNIARPSLVDRINQLKASVGEKNEADKQITADEINKREQCVGHLLSEFTFGVSLLPNEKPARDFDDADVVFFVDRVMTEVASPASLEEFTKVARTVKDQIESDLIRGFRQRNPDGKLH